MNRSHPGRLRQIDNLMELDNQAARQCWTDQSHPERVQQQDNQLELHRQEHRITAKAMFQTGVVGICVWLIYGELIITDI